MAALGNRAVRQRAMRDMFREVEARWGSLASLVDASLEVETGPLTAGALRRLFSHETLALRVPGFIKNPAPLADALVDAAASAAARNWSVSSSRGLESSDVRAVGGTPFNVAVETQTTDRYFAEDVASARAFLRAAQNGGDATAPSALDRLRCDLDDSWPGGCVAARDAGTGLPHHVGLGRVMAGPTRWADGFAHVDELAPLSTSGGAFSANCYLRQPAAGGHLELWPLGPWSRWDFYRNAHTLSKLTSIDEGDQRALREALPAPKILRVRPGDLVLLCVQRPHAVTGWASADVRASLQSFLTFRGDAAALTLEA